MKTVMKFLLALPLAAFFLATPTAAQDLQLHGYGRTLAVAGGEHGLPCGMLVGLERTLVPLPGGATLHVVPLAVVVLGDFDRAGKYEIELNYHGPVIDPFEVLLQAATVTEDERFKTSNLGALFFDGGGHFDFRAL